MIGSDKYKTFIAIDAFEYNPIGSPGPYTDQPRWFSIKLTKQPIISSKLQYRPFRYARKSTNWKFTRYENPYIYDQIKTAVHAPSTFGKEIRVKLELWDDYATLTSTEYLGYIPLSGIFINEDNGVIELTPVEIASGYDWYEEHKNDKHDIYNELTGTEVLKYHVETIIEEYYVPYDYVPFPTRQYYLPRQFNSAEYVVPEYDQVTDYVTGYAQKSWCQHFGFRWHCIKANGPGSTLIVPGYPGADEYWVKPDPYGDSVWRVWRYICDMPFDTVTAHYIHGNGIFQTGFPSCTDDNADAYNCEPYRWYSLIVTGVETGDMYLTIQGFKPDVLSCAKNHKLLTVINHMITDSGLVVSSQFFQSATNPVTGYANALTNIRIIQNEIIKGISDESTSGEITLEELLNDICELFQLSWHMDSSYLYIEHLNFYQNGLSYTVPATVYTDLTAYATKYQTVHDPDGTESDNVFRFSLTDCPAKELFKFIENGSYDYDGQIVYDSKFVKKSETVEHNISKFVTDLNFLLAWPGEGNDDFYCLIAADSSNVIIRRSTGLRWTQGDAVTANPFLRHETEYEWPYWNYPNGDLQWNNLLNDFYNYQRPFTKGAINGYYPPRYFDYDWSQKIKKQREIKFPRLEAGAFDPYKLITTNMGNGQVETFEIDSDTDWIKVELLYEES